MFEMVRPDWRHGRKSRSIGFSERIWCIAVANSFILQVGNYVILPLCY